MTVTEIRPDGKETYVQSGWLRAGARALDPEAVAATGREYIERNVTHADALLANPAAGRNA